MSHISKRPWKLLRASRAWINDPGVRTPPFISNRWNVFEVRAKGKWRHNIRAQLKSKRTGWNSLADYWRAIKHPRLWWTNQYWIGKGGTNRKNELRLRLQRNVRRRKGKQPIWMIMR